MVSLDVVEMFEVEGPLETGGCWGYRGLNGGDRAEECRAASVARATCRKQQQTKLLRETRVTNHYVCTAVAAPSFVVEADMAS